MKVKWDITHVFASCRTSCSNGVQESVHQPAFHDVLCGIFWIPSEYMGFVIRNTIQEASTKSALEAK